MRLVLRSFVYGGRLIGSCRSSKEIGNMTHRDYIYTSFHCASVLKGSVDPGDRPGVYGSPLVLLFFNFTVWFICLCIRNCHSSTR